LHIFLIDFIKKNVMIQFRSGSGKVKCCRFCTMFCDI